VDDLRGSADEPDRGDRPERHIGAGGADVDTARVRVEPRSRAEYAADLEQQVVSGWDRPSFGSRMGQPLDGVGGFSGAADGAAGADGVSVDGVPAGGAVADGRRDAGRPDTPREAVRRFEPGRAGLPEISVGDAVAYIDAHCGDRPWLAAARDCSPEVQRIFAALDRGGGHAHIRHEGWVTEEMNELRVRCLEDPAQLDMAKRAAGIDGTKSGDQPHRCGSIATRITDPDAFAVAFARGIEHPDVRAALDTDFKEKRAPGQVTLPIAELLGSDSHRYCTGWQLEAVDGSMKTAREHRDAWAEVRVQDAVPDVPEPKARPVETFSGGTMIFMFGPNRPRNGYEIVTMYVNPPECE
jgi:hypothetical protein